MIPKGKIKIKTKRRIQVEPDIFQKCAKGHKNFLIRLSNQDFKIGDQIIISEYDGKGYTGREIIAVIKYSELLGVNNEFIVFSFKKLSVTTEKVQNYGY